MAEAWWRRRSWEQLWPHRSHEDVGSHAGARVRGADLVLSSSRALPDLAATNDSVVRMDFQYFNKTATRLGEAAFLSFAPAAADGNGSWYMDVMGQPVDPTDVVVNGTRHLHCVGDGGVRHTDAAGTTVAIRSMDAALVVPGHLRWMQWGGEQLPDMRQGWHWVLHENAWNSASPSWLPFEDTRPGGDMRYRFELHVGARIKLDDDTAGGGMYGSWGSDSASLPV